MRLQNTTNPFKPIRKRILRLHPPRNMRNHQTRRPFIQYQLPRINHIRQLSQQPLNTPRIRNQIVYNLRPRLVQTLVPYTRRPELDGIAERFARGADVLCALVEELLAEARLHEVHFVDEDEDFGGGGAFGERADDV